jgi:hypothetical protein
MKNKNYYLKVLIFHQSTHKLISKIKRECQLSNLPLDDNSITASRVGAWAIRVLGERIRPNRRVICRVV